MKRIARILLAVFTITFLSLTLSACSIGMMNKVLYNKTWYVTSLRIDNEYYYVRTGGYENFADTDYPLTSDYFTARASKGMLTITDLHTNEKYPFKISDFEKDKDYGSRYNFTATYGWKSFTGLITKEANKYTLSLKDEQNRSVISFKDGEPSYTYQDFLDRVALAEANAPIGDWFIDSYTTYSGRNLVDTYSHEKQVTWSESFFTSDGVYFNVDKPTKVLTMYTLNRETGGFYEKKATYEARPASFSEQAPTVILLAEFDDGTKITLTAEYNSVMQIIAITANAELKNDAGQTGNTQEKAITNITYKLTKENPYPYSYYYKSAILSTKKWKFAYLETYDGKTYSLGNTYDGVVLNEGFCTLEISERDGDGILALLTLNGKTENLKLNEYWIEHVIGPFEQVCYQMYNKTQLQIVREGTLAKAFGTLIGESEYIVYLTPDTLKV